MKNIIVIVLILITCYHPASAEQMRPLGTIIQFASMEKGRSLLGTEDDYTAEWSEFDIQSRLQKTNGDKQELILFGEEQVMDWTVEEEQKIRQMFARIDSIVHANKFYWPLPEKVYLIKSTLKEEGGAVGYTRGNFIVFRQDAVFMDDAKLQKLILHEIFHVLTRNNAEYRKEFYEIIGFTVSNPIVFPKPLSKLRITNPDAHAIDSYITLTGPDSNRIETVMILYSDKPWQGGLFFQYIQIGFLEIIGELGAKTMVSNNDHLPIYSADEVSGFFEQIGMNTHYIIDPEEIMADNFAFAFRDDISNFPNPEIIEKIQQILKQH